MIAGVIQTARLLLLETAGWLKKFSERVMLRMQQKLADPSGQRLGFNEHAPGPPAHWVALVKRYAPQLLQAPVYKNAGMHEPPNHDLTSQPLESMGFGSVVAPQAENRQSVTTAIAPGAADKLLPPYSQGHTEERVIHTVDTLDAAHRRTNVNKASRDVLSGKPAHVDGHETPPAPRWLIKNVVEEQTGKPPADSVTAALDGFDARYQDSVTSPSASLPGAELSNSMLRAGGHQHSERSTACQPRQTSAGVWPELTDGDNGASPAESGPEHGLQMPAVPLPIQETATVHFQETATTVHSKHRRKAAVINSHDSPVETRRAKVMENAPARLASNQTDLNPSDSYWPRLFSGPESSDVLQDKWPALPQDDRLEDQLYRQAQRMLRRQHAARLGSLEHKGVPSHDTVASRLLD